MKKRVSVAMATYNGEKYIKEQVESILKQLNENDELIISDDGSTDDTINILESFQKKDSRIKIYEGPKNGIKQNFANAISKTEGKYIFLADQDDIWMDSKVKTIIEIFESDNTITLITHDSKMVNQDLEIINESFFDFRKVKPGFINNLIKNSFIGCCMAFRSELKEKILPIPNDIPMHDQWIGLVAELDEKTRFINDKLLLYRRHNENNSQFKKNSLATMLKNRLNLIKNLIKRKNNGREN